MEGFLDERQRATNNNLQRLEIELIDIEESLRFAQRGPVNLRENFYKCLKAFYEIDEFVLASLNEYVYLLLRKILDCISAAFCKAMDLLMSADETQKPKGKLVSASVSATPLIVVPIAINRGPQGLGGVRIAGSNERGIDVAHQQPTELLSTEVVAVSKASKLLDSEQEDEIERTMNEIRAYMNGHFCKTAAPEGCMQAKLLSILNYFNNCEKQAASFLEDKNWQEGIETDLGFLSTLNSFEEKRETRDRFAHRFRSLMQILQKLMEQVKHHQAKEREALELLMERQQNLERERSKQYYVHRETTTQAIQTTEIWEMSTLQEFINEKTLLLESQVRQNEALAHQIYQYKELLEQERGSRDTYRQDAERASTQLAKMRSVLQPLTQQMAQMELQYRTLQQKLENLWNTDIKDCVEQHTKSYTIEMRLSIMHIIEAILSKLGVVKPSYTNSKPKRQKFKFRVGKFKTIQTPDLYSSFVEDVNDTKDELTAIRQNQELARKLTQKRQDQTTIVQDNSEEGQSSRVEQLREDDADCTSKGSISDNTPEKENISPAKPRKEVSSSKKNSVIPQKSFPKQKQLNQNSETVRIKKNKKESSMSQTVNSSGFGNQTASKYKQRNNYSNQMRGSKYHRELPGASLLRKTNINVDIAQLPPAYPSLAKKIDTEQETQTENPTTEDTEVNTVAPPDPTRVIHCQTLATQTSGFFCDKQTETQPFEQFHQAKSSKLLTMGNKPLQNHSNPSTNSRKSILNRRLQTEQSNMNNPWIRSSNRSYAQIPRKKTSELVLESLDCMPQQRLPDGQCYEISGNLVHKPESYPTVQPFIPQKNYRRYQTEQNDEGQLEVPYSEQEEVGGASPTKQRTCLDQNQHPNKNGGHESDYNWLGYMFSEKMDRLSDTLFRLKKGRNVIEHINQLATVLGMSMRINRSNLNQCLQEVRNAHLQSCKSELCDHLKRFYENLKKLVVVCSNNNRASLPLRPLVIRGIEYQGNLKHQ